ncbi:hypothetical protein [Roseospira marina]|uniref:hypothetical protein n=1 Tax=Roseospira marina TaxID=140057 RepID=UPI0014784AB1|nr:hypothetical protein [Roseospira marina]MBB4313188.1 hypothetical protein [Roseospira marina]MBB5086071.1 hypothetical protein [Roseospira marina]
MLAPNAARVRTTKTIGYCGASPRSNRPLSRANGTRHAPLDPARLSRAARVGLALVVT